MSEYRIQMMDTSWQACTQRAPSMNTFTYVALHSSIVLKGKWIT